MNYALTSSRKIGKYYQKIITTYFGAPRATNRDTLDKLEWWHEQLNYANANLPDVEAIKYLGFTENEGSGDTNTGETASGTFVVLSEIEGEMPKTTTFRLENLTHGNIIANIYNSYHRLTDSVVDDAKNYLISVIIDLH